MYGYMYYCYFDDNISETDSYEYLFNISTDTATEVRLYMLYE